MRAAAALHALTSVETFMLRRDHGLPLAKVKQTILEPSRFAAASVPVVCDRDGLESGVGSDCAKQLPVRLRTVSLLI